MPARDLELLIDAAHLSGRIATSFDVHHTQKWDKPDGAGPVTKADLAVNKALHETLCAARPDYGWLSEESEDSTARLSRKRVFIIDPIDGTRSFIEGSDTWSHSLAIAQEGQVIAAVVYLPKRQKLYSAALGQGAFLNGQPICVTDQEALAQSNVLCTKANMQPHFWPNGLPQAQRHHRPSLAYRLALVAQGRFDAMLTFRPSWEWDIAAGALLVREAGGEISDQLGNPLCFNSQNAQLNGVIAAPQKMQKDILAQLGVP